MSIFVATDKQRWEAFVWASDHASCYHQIGWKEVIEKSFGHHTYYLISENKLGNIDGILPLVWINSALFGNYLISLPYFNYGGACSVNLEGFNKLLEEAIKIATEVKSEHIELRHTEHLYKDLPVKMAKVSMRLNLPDFSQDLLKSFSSKLRSQIKRPEKEGMFCKIGKLDELINFYNVFSQNMRDLGTPVYAKSFFYNILKTFPETSWICTVYTKEEIPVATGFLIGFKETMEIPWASSLRTYNSLSPNMLLYWSVLKFSCEKGYRIFDFGRSTPGEGPYRFKEQWGAKPVQLYWHYWLAKENKLPEINPKNPKYQLAIRVWKKLPIFVTRILGPHIIKNVP